MNSRKKKQQKTDQTDQKTARWLLWILPLLVLMVLSPMVGQEFLNYDDDWMIFENPNVVNLTVEKAGALFGEFYKGQYAPLPMIIMGLLYKLGTGSALAFKAGAIVIHLANTLLVFMLLKLLFRNVRLAVLAAAFFALHPVQAESVAWLSAAWKMGLFALFALATLLAWTRYIYQKQPRHYWLALLMMLLAVFSKEQAIILPLLMMTISWYKGMNFSRIRHWTPLVPFFAISLAFTVITYLAVSSDIGIGGQALALPDRIYLLSHALVSYFRLLLWPVHLSPFYGIPQATTLGYFVFPLLAVLIIAGLWIMARKDRRVAWALLFFAATLLLSFALQVVSLRDTLYADRYLYLGVPAFFAALILTLEKMTRRRLTLLFVAVLLVASFITHSRIKTYQDSETLWTAAIEGPYASPLAYTNRGRHYRQHNQTQKALADYNKALELNPDFYLALNNRGKIFFDAGHHDHAILDFQKALDINPTYVPALNNRGIWHASQNQLAEAIDDLSLALQHDPYHADALANRALALYYTNSYLPAIDDINAYLEIHPADASMFNLRALCHRGLNDHEAALADLNQAIALDPHDGRYFQNRSFLHNDMGNHQQAWNDIRKARELGVQVSPEYIRQFEQATP